jgi:hypothetical protein
MTFKRKRKEFREEITIYCRFIFSAQYNVLIFAVLLNKKKLDADIEMM